MIDRLIQALGGRANRARAGAIDSVTLPRASGSIYRRREIAVVPVAALALLALLRAASEGLQPGGGSQALVAGCLIFAACTTIAAFRLQTETTEELGGSLAISGFATLAVTAAVCAAAYGDAAPSSLYLGVLALLACYLAMVQPPHRSVRLLAIPLAATIVVQTLDPATTTMTAIAISFEVIFGWMIGVLGHLAHRRAARIAVLRSRSDVLTGMLNRRGFFEQFPAELEAAAVAERPLSLISFDLDAFKPVNDNDGHAAGDELLHWVGGRLAELAPADGALGRLGGDEFALILPGLGRDAAEAVARNAHEVLAERIGVSYGIAEADGRVLDCDELLRMADAELYAAKARLHGNTPADPRGAHTGGEHLRARRTRGTPSPALVNYSALRAAGGAPQQPGTALQFGWLIRGGMWAIALLGVFVWLATISDPGDDMLVPVVRYLGLPWVACHVILGALKHDDVDADDHPRWLLYVFATMLTAGGVAAIALASNGLASPFIAGLYLKVMYDAFLLRPKQALRCVAITGSTWLVIAAFGPSSALPLVPFELGLFATAFALGTVAYRAFQQASGAELALAQTDGLTGLNNRAGFEQNVDSALKLATRRGQRVTLMVFDLDDFKSVNDEFGHEAGDDLLRRVADVAQRQLPGSHSVARLGGDEFAAALTGGTFAEASEAAAGLRAALKPVVGASVGFAVYPDEGGDATALMQVADRRAYAAKRDRTRR